MLLWGCGIELYGVEYGVWSSGEDMRVTIEKRLFPVADMLLNA
jgi:hypothetical protein